MPGVLLLAAVRCPVHGISTVHALLTCLVPHIPRPISLYCSQNLWTGAQSHPTIMLSPATLVLRMCPAKKPSTRLAPRPRASDAHPALPQRPQSPGHLRVISGPSPGRLRLVRRDHERSQGAEAPVHSRHRALLPERKGTTKPSAKGMDAGTVHSACSRAICSVLGGRP